MKREEEMKTEERADAVPCLRLKSTGFSLDAPTLLKASR